MGHWWYYWSILLVELHPDLTGSVVQVRCLRDILHGALVILLIHPPCWITSRSLGLCGSSAMRRNITIRRLHSTLIIDLSSRSVTMFQRNRHRFSEGMIGLIWVISSLGNDQKREPIIGNGQLWPFPIIGSQFWPFPRELTIPMRTDHSLWEPVTVSLRTGHSAENSLT